VTPNAPFSRASPSRPCPRLRRPNCAYSHAKMPPKSKESKAESAPSTYELGDTVLGKIRGYPPWPGQVRRPLGWCSIEALMLCSPCALLGRRSRGCAQDGDEGASPGQKGQVLLRAFPPHRRIVRRYTLLSLIYTHLPTSVQWLDHAQGHVSSPKARD
jgi:hypothetical protein